jgi:TldD protein
VNSLAKLAIDTASARGALYADARAVRVRKQSLVVKNGAIGSISETESLGIGIRAIAGGAWGFAATRELGSAAIEKAAADAVAIARASALVKRADVALAPVAPARAEWRTEIAIDPFEVPFERKVDALMRADAAMRGIKGVTVAEGHMDFAFEDQWYLSTEGAEIHQVIVMSGSGIVATAVRDGEVQTRSYPAPFGGQWATRGYELVEETDLPAHAEKTGEEAVQLLGAPQCPSGVYDLILGSGQLGLQIHESCGHPIELDRVLGTEANFAGTSFLTLDRRGKLRYGSSLVNIVADATREHGPGPGTFGFDDEGVPARRTEIVSEGIFRGYLTSRETAALVGQTESNGSMRADGWSALPLIRMTNVSLLPGASPLSLEALIADTKRGIFMDSNRSWSIDDRRLNFQFGTEYGWEIIDGKRTRLVKNPTYGGTTPEFWNSCDAICGPEEWILWGIPTCGKGEPMQIAATGHGAAPARFRGVRIGVGYAR